MLFRSGDVIVRVNGTDTPTQTALSQVLAQLSPGDTVEVVIRPADGAGERTVKVTLGELPGE